MGLSRSWSEFRIRGLEDLDGAFNNVFFHCFDSLTICFLCLVLNNPLHDAAENGHLVIVKLLLIYGADINTLTNDGETVLHSMLHGRNLEEPYPEQKLLEVMEELLNEKYNIDLKLKCGEGLTPLETAIKLGRLKMAKMIAKVLCPKPKISDSIYPLKQLL